MFHKTGGSMIGAGSVKPESPKDSATLMWTHGDESPNDSFWFKRKYYKQVDGAWYSLNAWDEWVPSSNNKEWFEKETKEGFFIPVANG